MKSKIIKVTFWIVLLIILSVCIRNYYAVNINDESQIREVLQNYLNTSNELEILKTSIDQNEFLVLYGDGEKIGLGILSKIPLSFGNYYKEFGGTTSGLIGEYNFSYSTGDKTEILLVAYGMTSELNDETFEVNFNGKKKEVQISSDEEYFIRAFRHKREKSDTWGRIEY